MFARPLYGRKLMGPVVSWIQVMSEGKKAGRIPDRQLIHVGER